MYNQTYEEYIRSILGYPNYTANNNYQPQYQNYTNNYNTNNTMN